MTTAEMPIRASRAAPQEQSRFVHRPIVLLTASHRTAFRFDPLRDVEAALDRADWSVAVEAPAPDRGLAQRVARLLGALVPLPGRG